MPNWFRKLVFDILGPMLLALPSDERKKMKEDDKNRNFYATKVQGAPYEIHRSQNQLVVSMPKIATPKKGEGEMESKCFHASIGSNLSMTPSDERMEEIVYGMRAIVAHLKETQETDAKVNDWHHAAAVLDIAFFWITAITILGSTLAFYFMIPNWVRELPRGILRSFSCYYVPQELDTVAQWAHMLMVKLEPHSSLNLKATISSKLKRSRLWLSVDLVFSTFL